MIQCFPESPNILLSWMSNRWEENVIKGDWKMKKKLIVVLLTLGLTGGLFACGNSFSQTDGSGNNLSSQKNGDNAEKAFDAEGFLKGIADEMTKALSELISCDAYLASMSASEDISRVVGEWKELTVDKSEPIYVIPLSADRMEDYINLMLQESLAFDEMPEAVKTYLSGRVGDSIGNMLNARMGGISVVAASSIARYTKTFVPEETVENQVWLLPCNEETAVCISFTNTGNGVLTASAGYVVCAGNRKEALETLMFTSVEELGW